MENTNNLLYIGLELDSTSKNTLLDFASSKLENENFNPKFFCHHMTIAFNNGHIPENILSWAKENEGKLFQMNTTHYGISSKAVAVRVETEAPSRNTIKHITLATSKNTNGKPVDSNYITNWAEFQGLVLYGRVKFFYKNSLNETKK